MNRRNVCLVAATVCFILAAIGCPSRIKLTECGLGLLCIALI